MESLPISVFPMDCRPYGSTYGEWTARWWQWLLSIPRPKSPAFDIKGDNANVNQLDRNVVFLCQTMDGFNAMDRTIRNRTITIKAGKSVLIPIINWVSVLYVDGQTDEELVSVAKLRMDVVSTLEITIDGMTIRKGLERYRVRSPFFDTMLPEDNIFELPAGPRHFVSDGYWIFVKAIERDTKLATFGSCSSGVNKFGIKYDIGLIY